MMRRKESGQALVEMAIITPILIFILIGVWEVGWALRGYLVLINANREAARFAVRPGYVKYDSEQPDFNPIVAHFYNSLSGQVPFSTTGVLIVSRIYIDTDYPCDPGEFFDAASPGYLVCNCDRRGFIPYTPTIALTPLDVPTFTFTYPATATETTRLDYGQLKEDLIRENLIHNCNLMKTTIYARPQIDDVIYVEFFFRQKQLFGFPLISNPLIDPIPMYGNTAMRRVTPR